MRVLQYLHYYSVSFLAKKVFVYISNAIHKVILKTLIILQN